MKTLPFLIGTVLILGGLNGIRKPVEWQYIPSNRYGGSSGQLRTISKTGTRYISFGAIALGGGVVVIAVVSLSKGRKNEKGA